MSELRPLIEEYRLLLSGCSVDGVAPRFVEPSVDDTDAMHAALAAFQEWTPHSDDAPAPPNERGQLSKTPPEIVAFDRDVLLWKQIVTLSSVSLETPPREFTVFTAQKLEAVNEADGAPRQVQSASLRNNGRVFLRLRDRLSHMKPHETIFHFTDSDACCLLLQQAAEDSYVAIPSLTPPMSADFISRAGSSVVCKTVKTTGRVLEVMTPHYVQYGSYTMHNAAHRSDPGTPLHHAMDERTSLRNVTVVLDDWGSASPSPRKERGWGDGSDPAVVGGNIASRNIPTGAPEPRQAVSQIPSSSASKKRGSHAEQIASVVERLTAKQLVKALLMRFSLSQLRDAIADSEPPSWPPQVSGRSNVAGPRETAPASQRPGQPFLDAEDILFGQTPTAEDKKTVEAPNPTSLRLPTQAQRENEPARMSSPPGELPTVKTREERDLAHMSSLQARPLDLRSLDETAKSGSSGSDDSRRSIGESRAPSVESAKTCSNTQRTHSSEIRPDELRRRATGSSSRSSILPLRPKREKPEEHKRHSPQTSMDDRSFQENRPLSRTERLPKTPNTPTPNSPATNYISEILKIAQKARGERKRVVIFVRGEQQGTLLVNCLASHGFQGKFFPLGALSKENLAAQVTQFEILITTPKVWNKLPMDCLRIVPNIVDSSEDMYRQDIAALEKRLETVSLQTNRQIQMHKLPFKQDETAYKETPHGPRTASRASEAPRNSAFNSPRPVDSAQTEARSDGLRETEPKKTYTIQLTQGEIRAIWTLRDEMTALSTSLRNDLAQKGYTLAKLEFPHRNCVSAWRDTSLEWAGLASNMVNLVRETADFTARLELTMHYMDACALIPFEGVGAPLASLQEVLRNQTATTLTQTAQTVISRIRAEAGVPGRLEPPESFSLLQKLLTESKTQTPFHAVICVRTGLVMNALKARLHTDASLSSWLTVCWLYTTKSGQKYRMSKTRQNEQEKSFSEAENAVMLMTTPYRVVATQAVKIDALFFYGVSESYTPGEQLPRHITLIETVVGN